MIPESRATRPAQAGGSVTRGFAAAVALLLLAWADSILALGRGWVPLGAGRFLLPVLSGVLLVAAATLVFARARDFYRRSARPILVVSAASFVGLLLAEAILEIRFPVPVMESLYHLRTPFDARTFRPDPDVMPGVSGPSRYRINSLGVRGDEPALTGRYRVLCIGGSTTECLYLDQAETWPHLVQEELRVAAGEERGWVGNAGFSGYATPEHLEFLRHSGLVPKMDCAVFLVGFNDFARALKESPPPAPFFHARMKIKPRLLTSNLSNLVSATAQAVRHRMTAASIEVEDPVGRNYVERRRRRLQADVSDDVPALAAAADEFEQRLEEIVSESRERGLQVLLVTQPVLWGAALSPAEIDLLWMGERKDGSFVSPAALRREIDRFAERVEAVAARRGVQLVDLGEMSGDPRYFYDDCHFNEVGAAEAARRIARGLLELRGPTGR